MANLYDHMTLFLIRQELYTYEIVHGPMFKNSHLVDSLFPNLEVQVPDPGEFLEPYSMLIDPADNLYIVDKGNDRIQKLTTNGIPLSAVGGFSTPEDMAIDQMEISM